MDDQTPLNLDRPHLDACHDRWIMRRHNLSPETDDETLPASWFASQCGGCRFYLPLTGLFASDWGVCSQETSVKDGQVVFEHDGCDQFSDAGGWDSNKVP